MNREQLAKVPHEIVRKKNEATSVKHRNGQQRSKRRLGEGNKSVRGGSGGSGGRERRGWRTAEMSAHRGNERAGEQAADPTDKKKSGQTGREINDKKIGRRDGKEEWRRRRGDSERSRGPRGNKR